MSKIVYIIPGFGENPSHKAYKQITKFFIRRKFKTIPVNISWKRKVMSDYVKQFLVNFKPKSKSQIYLFGFSFGAIIALLASLEIETKLLILCSLSPYFKEDINFLKKSWKIIIGKKRVADLTNYSFNKIAKKINCKTILIVGSEEAKEVKRRINDAHKKLKNSTIMLSSGAKHNISQKEYLNTLENLIAKI